jgi:hypothetical protein
MVTFTGSQDISDEQISILHDIKSQLVWLNVSHTRITDQQMAGIARLDNLRVLYLNNTAITDSGLSQVTRLPELRMLSLVGTHITDQSIPTFLQLKNLTNLFLFQSSLSQEGIGKILEALPEIKVDTGNYQLKKLPSDTIVYKKVSLVE